MPDRLSPEELVQFELLLAEEEGRVVRLPPGTNRAFAAYEREMERRYWKTRRRSGKSKTVADRIVPLRPNREVP